MIENLETLIKVSKNKLDQKRKDLSQLLDKKDGINKEIQIIDEQFQQEYEFLNKKGFDEVIFNSSMHIYRQGIEFKKEKLNKRISELEPKIKKLSDEITEIFSEMKKYEQVKNIKITEMEKEIRKKQQIEIDEIAMTLYNREN